MGSRSLAAICIFFAFLVVAVLAQDGSDTIPTSNLPSECTFSCPTEDLNALPLAKRRGAVGFESYYSIFECVYHSASSHHLEHKCSYYKPTGSHILGHATDACPPFAIPCDADNTTPQFSNQPVEVPPWVEGDRYLLYLKEHHRG